MWYDQDLQNVFFFYLTNVRLSPGKCSQRLSQKANFPMSICRTRSLSAAIWWPSDGMLPHWLHFSNLEATSMFFFFTVYVQIRD